MENIVKRVKCIMTEHYDIDITEGKEYDVLRVEQGEFFYILDDKLDENLLTSRQVEILN
jgi:hypothetical protein